MITLSLSPGQRLGWAAWHAGARGVAFGCWGLALALLLAAFLLVPAGMTRLGCEGDRTVLRAPWRLWLAVRSRLRAYVWGGM
ncbi:hypothetical protein [Deinococcus arenae]|uniref:hypothetical protein n=1 Tax=Deinococcus arenae TaxID=1452751 RepID=UPI0016664690|nr:hypothetical protein [Deinococcus arenae]